MPVPHQIHVTAVTAALGLSTFVHETEYGMRWDAVSVEK